MTGTQQPPIENWQWAQSGGQPPQPAATRRRGRRVLVIMLAVAVVVIGGVVAAYFTLSTPKGSLALPRTLLNLPRATSPAGTHIASSVRKKELAGSDGKLSGVVAGVYGRATGPWFAVAGGGICGTCSAKSASVLAHNLVGGGYSDAAPAPAGPKGGAMACGSQASQGTTVIRCTWVDDSTAGDILFENGAASSLADAAVKANQVRAAVER